MPRSKKPTEMPSDPLDAMLARLKLPGIRDQLDSLLDDSAPCGRTKFEMAEPSANWLLIALITGFMSGIKNWIRIRHENPAA